jgi:hypothetical protein
MPTATDSWLAEARADLRGLIWDFTVVRMLTAEQVKGLMVDILKELAEEESNANSD